MTLPTLKAAPYLKLNFNLIGALSLSISDDGLVKRDEGVMVIDTKPDASAIELLGEAIDEARALLKVEADLTRDELRRDMNALKTMAVTMVLSMQLAAIAVTLLLVSAAIGLFSHPAAATLGIGVFLLAAALGLAGYGYSKRTKLEDTKKHITDDIRFVKQLVKEGLP